MSTTIGKKLETLIERALEGTPFEVILVEYKPAGKDWVLRTFIDHPDGVTLDHCETVTHMISELPELDSLIDRRYHLEVSSPGVDRPLVKPADFQRFLQERVHVRTNRAIDQVKRFTGILCDADEDSIEILQENDQKRYRIAVGDIAKATLKPILKFN